MPSSIFSILTFPIFGGYRINKRETKVDDNKVGNQLERQDEWYRKNVSTLVKDIRVPGTKLLSGGLVYICSKNV